ncbi:hypothetical protein [Brevibacillus sp. NRS-1366]|uniref:hypothetical protein n=1 Tax=Brevibacillus sp. NRS-1366 TaxID=3233899 RepID=UPI003D1D013A
MKNLYKPLFFSLVIHLMVFICIFAAEKYDEYKTVQEIKKQIEAIQKENPDADVGYSLFYSSEDENDLYKYFIITIPAAMGMFVLFSKLRH